MFSAPQLSLYEMRDLAALCDGRRFAVPLLAVTSPQIKPDADRMGYTARIETAGGTVLSGMCFYQSYAREIAEANGWKRLATNSAKLVNILGGYGYRADAGLDGGMRGGGGERQVRVTEDQKSFAPARRWDAKCAATRWWPTTVFPRATISTASPEHFSRRATSSPANPMSARY